MDITNRAGYKKCTKYLIWLGDCLCYYLRPKWGGEKESQCMLK